MPMTSIGRPTAAESSPYHLRYIDQVPGEDVLAVLEAQLEQAEVAFEPYSETASLHRYAPGKWSVREVLNHIIDTERIFTFRALWIARGLDGPLVSFDQQTAAAGALADAVPFAHHRAELQHVRHATLSLFAGMPEAAWSRTGIVADHAFTPRALAYMTAGHLTHHLTILRERYAIV